MLEKMRIEFEIMGADVQLLTINDAGALEQLQGLVDKCSFPILQDQDDIDVWGLMQGKKDDMFVYAADGTLATYLPFGGEVSIDLSTDEGYANVKDALMAQLP